MKKTIIPIISVFFAAMLASCDLDSSPNGRLDGYWRLMSIDTLTTEGTLPLDDELRFWSIQNKLLQFVDRKNNTTPYYLRFSHEGNELTVFDPFSDISQSEDEPLTDISVLKHYGVSEVPMTFSVTKLSRKALILQDSTLRLQFKKYD